MSKPRIFKLGVIENGAADGGDIFAVVNSNPKITFGEMLDGVEVINKLYVDKMVEALDEHDCPTLSNGKCTVCEALYKYRSGFKKSEFDFGII